MSRYLLVVPPLVGHINPLAAVAGELAARKHEVAWAGSAGLLARLLPGSAPDEVFDCDIPSGLVSRPPEQRQVAALRFLWERWFAPLADAMAPGVATAIDEFRPDLVITDQQAIAGALVAERTGIPYLTSSTTSVELAGSVGLPKVDQWVGERLAGLRRRLGDPDATYDPRFSPRLTIVYSTPELAGPAPVDRGTVAFVGPAIGARPDDPAFPWAWLADHDGTRSLILVTLGTANSASGERFLGECVAAVRQRADRLRAIITDPGGVLGQPRPDSTVLVLPSTPQLALLDQTAAVICHAGHNTVTESLWHGVPLVVAPIRDDQPAIAAQVTGAGAGIRVRFDRGHRQAVGAALDGVLTDPHYAAVARRIGDSFRAAGGARKAADLIEKSVLHPEITMAGR